MEYKSSNTEEFIWPAFQLKKVRQKLGGIGGDLILEEYELSTYFRVERKGIYYLVPFCTWVKYNLSSADSSLNLHEGILKYTVIKLKEIEKGLILTDDNCFLDSYKEKRKTLI